MTACDLFKSTEGKRINSVHVTHLNHQKVKL